MEGDERENPEEPVVEPETPEEPEPEPQPDEGKPGGDDPQAVRARREYERRVAAEKEAEAERIRVARLEGEIAALKEGGKKEEDRVFSIAEVNAAVEAGKIDRQQADRYIEEVILPKKLDERLKQRETEQQKLQPIERAEQDIEEYKKHLPFLLDKNHPKFIAVAEQYRKLVADGLPANYVTQRVALEMTHGTLDKIRKQAEIESATRARGAGLMPVDAGGGPPKPTNGKVDITKAPAHLVAYWDKTGTSVKDREAEMAYWQKTNKQGSQLRR